MSLLYRDAGLFALRLKEGAFEEESEWRLVALADVKDPAVGVEYRASLDGVVPYLPLPLAEGDETLALSDVYVGPRLDPERACLATAALLSKYKYPPEIVKPSGIPLR